MKWWLAAALLGGTGGLAAARFIDSAGWFFGLVVSGASYGLAAGLVVGLLLRARVPVHWPFSWLTLTSLLLAVGALTCRGWLLTQVLGESEAHLVALGPLMLAGASVSLGVLALAWGTLALSEGLQEGDSESKQQSRRLANLIGGAASVSLALYCVAPLWHLLGLRINHWTLAGLFGLAAVAYGAGASYRWVAARLQGTHR